MKHHAVTELLCIGTESLKVIKKLQSLNFYQNFTKLVVAEVKVTKHNPLMSLFQRFLQLINIPGNAGD